MKKKGRCAALLLALIVAAAVSLPSCRLAEGELTYEEAEESLNALLKKVVFSDESAYISATDPGLPNVANEMPDIKAYPLTVKGTGQLDVEIVSSTEKAVADTQTVKTDSWLLHMAEKFNAEGALVNGKAATVSIRPIASGTATDYILSGAYIPEAFTPSNELWAEMIQSKGIAMEMVEKRLCGNTAGFLMEPASYERFVAKYKDATMANVYSAVLAGDLKMGYTNPYTSSTGLNNLVSMLAALDPANPASDEAAKKLSSFQAVIPSTSFTTAELISKAASGSLNCLSMEYQAFSFKKEFQNWMFIPFGVRHDSPLYAMSGLEAEKREVLSLFAAFCLRQENQAEAKANYGFNAFDEYKGDTISYGGETLIAAQQVWKKTKDAGRPVAAVFVADESGSMEGTPISELKNSLKFASQYISDTNYIGLVSYSSDVRVYLPVAQFGAQQKIKFLNAVDYLAAGGSTATYNAVLVGLKLLADAKKEVPNAKLMMFVLSDGESSVGSRYYSMDKVAPVIQGLGIPIHTLGYNVANDELKSLAAINEASFVGTNMDDIVYQLKNVFNAQM